MGMILDGAGGNIWLNVFEWGQLLRLGQMYGWVPAGTILDEATDEWNGGYQTNDWQRVTADDARNLADALSRALPGLPVDDYLMRDVTDPLTGAIALKDIERLTPRDWFGGDEGRQSVQKYIAFCRAGEFVIK